MEELPYLYIKNIQMHEPLILKPIVLKECVHFSSFTRIYKLDSSTRIKYIIMYSIKDS